MNDPITALIRVAVFALAHAKAVATGETKVFIATALTSCSEALDAHQAEVV